MALERVPDIQDVREDILRFAQMVHTEDRMFWGHQQTSTDCSWEDLPQDQQNYYIDLAKEIIDYDCNS